jgi:hypothetical protein
MGANQPWKFLGSQKCGRTDQPAETYPTLISQCGVDLEARTHLQSTVGGASLVNPERGSMITVTWNAPTTARRRSFGFNTSSWISNCRSGVDKV